MRKVILVPETIQADGHFCGRCKWRWRGECDLFKLQQKLKREGRKYLRSQACLGAEHNAGFEGALVAIVRGVTQSNPWTHGRIVDVARAALEKT